MAGQVGARCWALGARQRNAAVQVLAYLQRGEERDGELVEHLGVLWPCAGPRTVLVEQRRGVVQDGEELPPRVVQELAGGRGEHRGFDAHGTAGLGGGRQVIPGEPHSDWMRSRASATCAIRRSWTARS